MSNYHSSPSHKCPQCEDTFQTIAACKHHIRGEHQPEIQIDRHPSITRVNGFFHCPKCNHKSQNARNFHRHPHIQEMKRISAPGHTSVETLQAPTRHSTLATARSPSAGPSLVKPTTPATARSPSAGPSLVKPTTPATPRSPAAGPYALPSIETVEGLDNDQRDKDYEPMDVDGASQPLYASAQELIQPSALHPLH